MGGASISPVGMRLSISYSGSQRARWICIESPRRWNPGRGAHRERSTSKNVSRRERGGGDRAGMRPWRPTDATVRRLLNGAFGAGQVAGWQVLESWAVLRANLVPGPPSTVVVKWLRDDPRGFRTDPAQQLTEYAALQFLAELGLDLSPRVLAADLPASAL